jgi:hypothetical protein
MEQILEFKKKSDYVHTQYFGFLSYQYQPQPPLHTQTIGLTDTKTKTQAYIKGTNKTISFCATPLQCL